MSAQPAEEFESAYLAASAKAATVHPDLLGPRNEDNVVYLASVPDSDSLRIERAVALIDHYLETGVTNLPELRAALTARKRSVWG
jgi:hypothetical protein